MDLVNFKVASIWAKEFSLPFLNTVKNCDSHCQILPPICGFYKKPFSELRALCVQAQLVVTAEVKRCFRSQRAVQPSSASTKYCLCRGYFQTSCAGVLLRRRAFPPATSPKVTCIVKSYLNHHRNISNPDTSFNNVLKVMTEVACQLFVPLFSVEVFL